jgi:hypothetical protein
MHCFSSSVVWDTSLDISFCGAVVAHLGAVVAHWEQWWLNGSSGGSLVATPDCKTAVLGLNPAISPAYSGLLS